jgi:competence protein ComEC
MNKIIFIGLLLIFCCGLLGTESLKIYQIDVNQGDAALIISPTNKYVLIDAGDDQSSYGDTVLNFLRSLGITHLDHILVSHYHQDHIGGIPRVIYGLSGPESNDSLLGWCYDRGDTYTTPTFINYRNAVGNKRRTVNLGETLDLGGSAYIYCLAKNGRLINGDSVLHNTGENYRSLVWVLEYGRFRFYTGGDLVGYNVSGERDVESKVAKIIRPVDVIKVNHHGSRNSSNNEFLDSLRPQVAIISQGVDPTNYDHPHQEVINRLVSKNCYIYQLNENPRGGTFRIPDSGKILNTTASITVNNYEYIINGDSYPIRNVNRNGVIVAVIEPTETIPEGMMITPKVKVKNLSNIPENFVIRFKIGNVYSKVETIPTLEPNDSTIITFKRNWQTQRGEYLVTCSLPVKYDTDIQDNVKRFTMVVTSGGWQRLRDIPSVVGVRYGGALTATTEALYALIGNNTREFFKYQPQQNSWTRQEPIPYSTYQGIVKQKAVKKGGALTFGKDAQGKSVLYALKGNSTSEFWRYNISENSWTQLPNIKIGSVEYKIKAGSSICYAETDSPQVFVLLGSDKNFSFLVFNIFNNTWQKRHDASGPKKFLDGSCLVSVRDTIFTLKSGTNEFFGYDIRNDTWFTRKNLPDTHPSIKKRKKVKAGASLTFDIIRNGLYAFKGGNTQEFWFYDVNLNDWVPLDTIPKSSSAVYHGASLAAFNGAVYALKGNNTKEFWRYTPRTPLKDLLRKSASEVPNFISHSPFLRDIIKIYSHDGRLIKVVNDYNELRAIKLPSGVYFIKENNQKSSTANFIKYISIK